MNKELIPQEVIGNKLLLIRGRKVMLDRDSGWWISFK